MARHLAIAVVALLASACGKPAEDRSAAPASEAAPEAPGAVAAPAKLVLTCGAPFTPDATAATLAEAFGAENVIPETVDGPEGEKLNVTAIYPSDPAKRIEAYFKDEEARTGLIAVTVKEEASVWTGPGGVKVGDGLEKVEAANGATFTVSGFDWDYGGHVVDWKNGKLKETAPGCRTSMRFRRDPGNQDISISGDIELSSDLPAMRTAKPVVSELGISW